MIEAVVNDLKLSQTRQYENSTALASAYLMHLFTMKIGQIKLSF